ncbi:MAG TPA: metal-sulfur cluster assembly factor [Burkholderiaceae bacterium]|jgi:metal-sulfur cluster biosynthetic enzyme|nr:metal-sulfur cluster assembly factor [Burkholderiaceae bacterium]
MAGDEPKRVAPAQRSGPLWDALRTVIDPEIGVNVVDLGLVYEIAGDERGLVVRMTMTSPTCPMAAMIEDDVRSALAPAAGGAPVTVEWVWEPRWDPSMMSGAARLKLLGL